MEFLHIKYGLIAIELQRLHRTVDEIYVALLYRLTVDKLVSLIEEFENQICCLKRIGSLVRID